MAFRRELRALGYIERGDVLRLKSYIRKHRHLRLDHVLPGGRSLLHAACALRDDACALLLLRKGADPMQRDASGNNALHVAAREVEKGGWKVYTDLVVPILKRCPQSIDVADHQGTTPRDILRRAEDLMERNSRRSASPDVSSQQSSEWREKLLAESMDEYQELYGQYEEDYPEEVPEVETFESWADRIYREYQARKIPSEPPGAKGKRVSVQKSSSAAGEKTYLQRQRQKEKELRGAQSVRYQKRCEEVFGRTGSSAKTEEELVKNPTARDCEGSGPTEIRTGLGTLGYSDIPWPLPGGTAEQMAQTIAAGGDPSDAGSYKRYLRAQRVTWHPDRFMQRCGSRLLAKDRERVLRTVTALSQELNRLAELTK
ncbi:NF-kappa-B inhibitor-like protein 1 [Bufo gargarizans]|uniref:NF-kappa-B inhibitor-like protein 1 n=1 Tax=Bufo gargarizans TaxID=30331 RepID=UPI001CF154B1|nr:NF-kappa-B inhibitor-like protein 1 [Bufo gargarizans]XP_044162596.1 NF-kappa-B inhibitor-like protein 1 [Bufo gargarizans]